MQSPRARYTLLIPTFNRSAYLRSLLGYLEARRFEYPVRVIDSSAEDALSQNRETVRRVRLDIAHEIYPPETPFCEKAAQATASVESTYCSFCADDDVVFTDQLNGLFDVLDANPGVAVAHGYYVNVRPGDDFDIWYTVYSSPSIAGDDGLIRIVEQMNAYQAIFYGVHRTSALRFSQHHVQRVKSLLAQEMLSSTLTLIAGGAYRTQDCYMARNTNPSIATEGWHPHQFFAIDPAELFREYADYRAITLEHLAADARCRSRYRPDQMQRVLDLVHLNYLAPMLSPDVMTHLIRQSMRPDTTSRQVIDDIWSTFVPPTEDGAGGRSGRRWARAAARLNPRNFPAMLARLRRLGGLCQTLRSQAKFDASFSRSLDRMIVRRTTRDGRSRRYQMPRSFLNQVFADGGQVTAAHLQTIISHLDDYV
jgi:glycosyltransferase domain-containing protein